MARSKYRGIQAATKGGARKPRKVRGGFKDKPRPKNGKVLVTPGKDADGRPVCTFRTRKPKKPKTVKRVVKRERERAEQVATAARVARINAMIGIAQVND